MDNSSTSAASSSPITFKALGWSLALLAVTGLTTAALVVGTLHFGNQTALAHKQAVAQQTETRNRLARANDDAREISEKISRYQYLINRGRTQSERRLEWVETLRSIKTARRLLGLDYEIAPQRPLDEKALAAGGFNFLASPMKLTMPLLHENDLLVLLADLSAQVQALISVKRCTIERVVTDTAQNNSAKLKADCDIDWITLQEEP